MTKIEKENQKDELGKSIYIPTSSEAKCWVSLLPVKIKSPQGMKDGIPQVGINLEAGARKNVWAFLSLEQAKVLAKQVKDMVEAYEKPLPF